VSVSEPVGLRVTVLLSVKVGDGLRRQLPLNVKVLVGVTSCVPVHEKDRLAVLEGPVWLPELLTVDLVRVFVRTRSRLPLNVSVGEICDDQLYVRVKLADDDGECSEVIVKDEVAERDWDRVIEG